MNNSLSTDTAITEYNNLKAALETTIKNLEMLDFDSLSIYQYNAILSSMNATNAVMSSIFITSYLRKDDEK